jgi:hypothetical protein
MLPEYDYPGRCFYRQQRISYCMRLPGQQLLL